MTVTIRPLQETDIPPIWQIAYGQAHEEWQNWNGPYFHDKPMTEEEMRAWVGDHFKNGIFVNGQPVGAVFAYYEDGQMKRWLDIGIVIYADDVWGQGIGTTALRLWLTKVFSMTDLAPYRADDLVRKSADDAVGGKIGDAKRSPSAASPLLAEPVLGFGQIWDIA